MFDGGGPSDLLALSEVASAAADDVAHYDAEQDEGARTRGGDSEGDDDYFELARLAEWTLQIARAMRSLSEPPPDVSVDTLVSQAAKDVVAAEKLRVLESGKGVYERRGPERHRRDMTTSTR